MKALKRTQQHRCPNCFEEFLRRTRKGCCPFCGAVVPLEKKGEDVRSNRILERFAQLLEERGVPFYVRKGSSAWKSQMHYAKTLINTSADFLRQASNGKVSVGDFVMAYLDHVMCSRTGDWIAEEPSLKKLLGNVFTRNAPSILRELEEQAHKARVTSNYSLRDEELIPIPRLG